MEKLDLYNDQGEKLNESIFRNEKTPEGKNIMLSVIYIKNSEGKYLIQKTSKEKKSRFTSTGGHVIEGENGLEAIQRELLEELGMKVNKKDIKHLATFKYPTKNCLFNVFSLEMEDLDISKLELQKEEVAEVYLLSKEKILDIIKKGNFLESHAYIFKNYIIK